MKRSEERNCGKGWGGGREALLNHIPFCPNGGQDFSHSSEERPRQQASSFPPNKTRGKGAGFCPPLFNCFWWAAHHKLFSSPFTK